MNETLGVEYETWLDTLPEETEMAMTLVQLRDRLSQIIEEVKGDETKLKLPVWVSIDISPRRRIYVPITAIWGGTLKIGKPDNNLTGYKDAILCIEARTNSDDIATRKR